MVKQRSELSYQRANGNGQLSGCCLNMTNMANNQMDKFHNQVKSISSRQEVIQKQSTKMNLDFMLAITELAPDNMLVIPLQLVLILMMTSTHMEWFGPKIEFNLMSEILIRQLSILTLKIWVRNGLSGLKQVPIELLKTIMHLLTKSFTLSSIMLLEALAVISVTNNFQIQIGINLTHWPSTNSGKIEKIGILLGTTLKLTTQLFKSISSRCGNTQTKTLI